MESRVELIQTTDALKTICRGFSGESRVAIDTEFIRKTTFWPQLCLIQIHGERDGFLIDARSPRLTLEPFFDLMRDSNILKIFHASDQDIQIFYYLSGEIPKNFVDTQVAAKLCGYNKPPSYERLVQDISGIQINKAARMTDWRKRPLTPAQIAYAFSDVTHLIPVYTHLERHLRTYNRLEWFQEEMRPFYTPQMYKKDYDTAWRRLRKAPKTPRSFLLMKELAYWREIRAQEKNILRRWVLSDGLLCKIALSCPRSLKALEALSSSEEKLKKKKQKSIFTLCQKCYTAPEDTLPSLAEFPAKKTLSGEEVIVFDRLKRLLQNIADTHQISREVIASLQDLKDIIKNDEANVSALKGWRRPLFGEAALRLKHMR